MDNEGSLAFYKLRGEKIENRLNDAKLAPAWINKIIIQSIR